MSVKWVVRKSYQHPRLWFAAREGRDPRDYFYTWEQAFDFAFRRPRP